MVESVKESSKKPDKQEEFKANSRGLEGNIPATFASDASHFEASDIGLLKTHGSYQQDNRDARSERRKAKQDKDWIFMIRLKIPGGRLTADQYVAVDELTQHGYGTLRITSRQGLQIHGVGKSNIQRVIRGVNDTRLTTLGACGDVNRNTMACPVSDLDWRAGFGLEKLAARLARHFAPQSTAYFEIWCDGEKWGEKITPNREEPFYGKTYLPRKFKIGLAVPEDNCIDLYTHDLGIEAVHDGRRLLGHDLIVGGGLGYTFSKPETHPSLGRRFVRVEPQHLLEAAETLVTIQNEHGDRTNRHHARFKYLIEDRGLDWLRDEMFRRMKRELPEAGPSPVYRVLDHLGWQEANDGILYLGIPIMNGRIQDTDEARIRTGIRTVVERFRPSVRLSPHHNMILAGIEPETKDEIDRILDDHGVDNSETITKIRRRALACPALPTCGLALAEAERAIPEILTRLEALGSGGHQIVLRMTGCPNSCVRTPNAEIAITGRGPGKYAIHVGGTPEGTRMAYLLDEKVEYAEIAPMLHQLIRAWQKDRADSQSFGEWSYRRGKDALVQILQNGH